MTTQYNIEAFTRGRNGFALPFCDAIYSVTLAANTEATVAVPLGAAMGNTSTYTGVTPSKNKYIAVFSCEAGVYACINGTAAVPAGSSLAASTSELVPSNQLWGKYCQSGDVIHVVSAGTPSCTIAFYAVQE